MKSTSLHVLGWTLALGAVSDWAFGTPLLFFPKVIIPMLGLPAVEKDVYVRLVGVLLILTGMFYFVTSIDPKRYMANVAVTIIGRTFLGPAFYLWYLFASHGEPIFWGLVALNLAFAAVHTWALGPGRWARLRAAFAIEDTEEPAQGLCPESERETGAA